MVGLELKLQRVIFLLTFQGQMRVFTVWPLFIWECKLNLVVRVEEGSGGRAGPVIAAPSAFAFLILWVCFPCLDFQNFFL